MHQLAAACLHWDRQGVLRMQRVLMMALSGMVACLLACVRSLLHDHHKHALLTSRLLPPLQNLRRHSSRLLRTVRGCTE